MQQPENRPRLVREPRLIREVCRFRVEVPALATHDGAGPIRDVSEVAEHCVFLAFLDRAVGLSVVTSPEQIFLNVFEVFVHVKHVWLMSLGSNEDVEVR